MRWAAAGSALTLAGLLGLACLGSGCSAVGYYAQSVGGHVDLMQRARPLPDWLADPATPPALRERLALAQRLRHFAVTDLALPDNASYTRYADLGRNAAVWNVVAAPELSLQLKTWCYPVMGCVGYRGYFHRDEAQAEAEAQRAAGREAMVYGVPAYSTLGWSNWLGGDPLLNTFVHGSEASLARLVFHELAHQVVYAADDTAFNESYATAVERLGLQRWQQAHGGAAEDPAVARRRADFRAITGRARSALAALYRSGQDDAAKRAGKAQILATLRAEHAALKAGPWAGYDGYDDWVARANNPALALQATYDGLVPGFERLFAAEGSDFARFHAAVRQLAALPAAQRHATLGDTPPP
ncbi:MAG: aminopeptidase [Burkholderiales bacterium PBB5]|nr:MAG: aminopeptidase [Burkholderiales bacterium PBB5]